MTLVNGFSRHCKALAGIAALLWLSGLTNLSADGPAQATAGKRKNGGAAPYVAPTVKDKYADAVRVDGQADAAIKKLEDFKQQEVCAKLSAYLDLYSDAEAKVRTASRSWDEYYKGLSAEYDALMNAASGSAQLPSIVELSSNLPSDADVRELLRALPPELTKGDSVTTALTAARTHLATVGKAVGDLPQKRQAIVDSAQVAKAAFARLAQATKEYESANLDVIKARFSVDNRTCPSAGVRTR